jgi:hypothetical protein
VARVWNSAPSADARACCEGKVRCCCDRFEREYVELWSDFASKPLLVTVSWALAGPLTVSPMTLGDCLAAPALSFLDWGVDHYHWPFALRGLCALLQSRAALLAASFI